VLYFGVLLDKGHLRKTPNEARRMEVKKQMLNRLLFVTKATSFASMPIKLN
jgi:hypothetical protein